MGYEFRLVLPVAQRATDIEKVLDCFEQTIDLCVIGRTSTGSSYAFAIPPRIQWPEDFVVMFDNQECYLNFHAATGPQQKVVLQTLIQCLHTIGIVGTFEEV